jgi:hypothetical protein
MPKALSSSLKSWVFVGMMNVHLPILHAALDAYIKQGKVPARYQDSSMLLLYLIDSAIEASEGDGDDSTR